MLIEDLSVWLKLNRGFFFSKGCFYNLLFERWPNRSISKLRKFVKNIHNQIAHVNMNMVQKLNFVTDP